MRPLKPPVRKYPGVFYLIYYKIGGGVGTPGAKYGEGVTDPQTVFDGAARGDVSYVHYCLEANGELVRATHGVERSSLLHVAANTGNFALMKVRERTWCDGREIVRLGSIGPSLIPTATLLCIDS